MNMKQQIERAVAKLPPLYSTDGATSTSQVCVYLFLPEGDATWILWEWDAEDRIAYGMCDLGLGFPEMGSVGLDEILEVRTPRFRLPVEMDTSLATIGDAYEHRRYPVPDWFAA